MDVFGQLKDKLLLQLRSGLPPFLSYHNDVHTLEVIKSCEEIAERENIKDGDSLLKLKLAALYHDAGYLTGTHEHEAKSCELFRSHTFKLFSNGMTDNVCELIMATQIPQSPKNKLAEILCDADLDYLGRDDFFIYSEKLYQEFKHFGKVKNMLDFDRLQTEFLATHRYFTASSKLLRQPVKEKNLETIRERMKQYPA
ncbi:MAG: HD domain-containing protein [Bacteroidia bacterium]|nr:HD domain-containing protein [Bacteroidia bacterium]